MRSKSKMVNYGIAYGMSSFGLAQRLRIARKEAAEIIERYFTQYPKIRSYMDEAIAFAHATEYVQTLKGRRRFLRDINSRNRTARAAAERIAINAPIQGTAAVMIKIAMIDIAAGAKAAAPAHADDPAGARRAGVRPAPRRARGGRARSCTT